jgi:ribA/ribD-fused uncharacterized protein
MRITEDRVYFWAGLLSNWSKVKGGIKIPAKCGIDGETEFSLPTSEHIFMYLKALQFKDLETAKKIIEAESPKEAKKLGRQVKNFDDEIWEQHREGAMWIALTLKYKCDKGFRDYLMDKRFRGKVFVEANPFDIIWSCGYIEDDPRIDMPENTWPGLNLLGKLLTKLRDNHERL